MGEASESPKAAALGNWCSQRVLQLWAAALLTLANTQQGSQHRAHVHACACPHNVLQLPDNRKCSSGREMHKIRVGLISYLS